MSQPDAFIRVQDLVDALGEETYMAIFDDFGSRSREHVDGSTPVSLVIRRAHAMVLSYLPNIYSAMPSTTAEPSTMSELLRHAELEVAQCYAYRRRPEFCRTYGAFPGGDMWRGAIELLQRIQSGEQRIHVEDHAPEDPPPAHGGLVADDGPKATIRWTADNSILGDW